jgi:hypothetical protein
MRPLCRTSTCDSARVASYRCIFDWHAMHRTARSRRGRTRVPNVKISVFIENEKNEHVEVVMFRWCLCVRAGVCAHAGVVPRSTACVCTCVGASRVCVAQTRGRLRGVQVRGCLHRKKAQACERDMSLGHRRGHPHLLVIRCFWIRVLEGLAEEEITRRALDTNDNVGVCFVELVEHGCDALAPTLRPLLAPHCEWNNVPAHAHAHAWVEPCHCENFVQLNVDRRGMQCAPLLCSCAVVCVRTTHTHTHIHTMTAVTAQRVKRSHSQNLQKGEADNISRLCSVLVQHFVEGSHQLPEVLSRNGTSDGDRWRTRLVCLVLEVKPTCKESTWEAKQATYDTGVNERLHARMMRTST